MDHRFSRSRLRCRLAIAIKEILMEAVVQASLASALAW